MTTERAELEIRCQYLERELASWRGKQLRFPNNTMYHEIAFLAELGRMRGELERIKLELGLDKPKLGCGGKRRAKIN